MDELGKWHGSTDWRRVRYIAKCTLIVFTGLAIGLASGYAYAYVVVNMGLNP